MKKGSSPRSELCMLLVSAKCAVIFKMNISLSVFDQINVKTAEPIEPKFCVGLQKFTCPQVRFVDDQNFKNLRITKFDFNLF